MLFEFSRLIDQIEGNTTAIKPELFHEIGFVLKSICHQFGSDSIAPQVRPSVHALANSLQLTAPTNYRDLLATLDTSAFKDMAIGTNSVASHIHFRELVNVLRAIVELKPTLDETQQHRLQSLLRRNGLHRT